MKTGQIIVKACIIVVMVFYAASYANLCPDCPGCQVQTGSPPNCNCQDDDSQCSGCKSCSGGSCSDDDSNCSGCKSCSGGSCVDDNSNCSGCESCSGGSCSDDSSNCDDPNFPYCLSAVCKECQGNSDCDGCAFCDLNNDCNSVVEVTIDTLDPNYFCVGSTVTFSASTDKSGLESEITWDIPGGDPNTGQGSSVNATFSDPNTYTIKAGCGDGADEIEIVVVDVNMIEIKFGPGASDWDDVTGKTIILLKGTEYQFRAVPNPLDASWPSGAPTWSGIETDTGPTIDVTFDTEGSYNLTAKCCSGSGKSVTIDVVEPEVFQVGFSGDHTLYKTPDSNDGWDDGITVITDPVYVDPNINDPVCVTKNSSSISLTNVKLKVSQALSYPAIIAVDAGGTEEWNESSAVNFTGETSDEASLSITGQIINQVKKYGGSFENQWKYKVPSGSDTWYTINNTNHTVYVTWGEPEPGGSDTTVQRMDWACDIADGKNTITLAAEAFKDAIASDPGYLPIDDIVYDPNSWVFLGSGNPGDCITLAMLATVGLEMIGIPADYCWSYPTADGSSGYPAVSTSTCRTVTTNTFSYNGETFDAVLVYTDNNFEAFFTVHDPDIKAFTVYPPRGPYVNQDYYYLEVLRSVTSDQFWVWDCFPDVSCTKNGVTVYDWDEVPGAAHIPVPSIP